MLELTEKDMRSVAGGRAGVGRVVRGLASIVIILAVALPFEALCGFKGDVIAFVVIVSWGIGAIWAQQRWNRQDKEQAAAMYQEWLKARNGGPAG